MSNEYLITPYDLAETMAYAEKPYMDMAVTGEKSEYEIGSLKALANFAGVTAARGYIDDIQALINHHAQSTTPENHDAEEKALHEKLDVTMATIILRHLAAPNIQKRAINALARESIHTLRDVLVYGKLAVMDIRNVGESTVNMIEECVVSELGDQATWLDIPSVQDIAKWCTNLDQVPSSTLFMVYPYPYPVHVFLTKTSVQRLLNMPSEELAQNVGYTGQWDAISNNFHSRPDAKRAAEVKAEAFKFAHNFTAVRNLSV